MKSVSDVVSALFGTLFPSWLIGFAAAAMAISALVPAAIMSIGAANLFTRNLWRPIVSPDMSSSAEASTATLVSLTVKFGALLFAVFLATQYVIDLRLLGGVWILQIFSVIVFSLYTRRSNMPGLFLGWLVVTVPGIGRAISQDLKLVFALHLRDAPIPRYIGIIVLGVNFVIAFALSAPRSSQCWHFRYSFAGKQRRISFGTYPALPLQDARELTSMARTQLAHGTDPGHHRRTARKLSKETGEKLFRSAAERWYKRKEVAGRAKSTLGKMRTYPDKDILPEIGSMLLQHITRAECARIQERFEKRDALNVAKKARG